MRGALVVSSLVLGALVVLGQPSPLGIVPEPVPGLSVAIWMERSQYVVGEEARVFVYLSKPAYLYLFDIEPTGFIRLLFPNPYSPNPYKPGGTHAFPDGSYVLRVRPPSGTETIQAVACLQPLSVPLGNESDPYPLLGPDPQSGKARVLGLVPQPGFCATAWTSFQILPTQPTWPCPPCGFGPCPPCWGVCPGTCWYYDSASGWQMVIGNCPGPGFCWCLGADGQWRFQIRFCLGNCD